ncbi:MAG: 4-(cytidine 5'-diphospho)-2-C-methyl-D-erythritol kinase [Ignavibacteria bacterium]|nr:4-(cytidine 5'-diphospho)-2-C-methyl-D-erythritol kinase [Ignavibacteria bacterium]
MQAYGLAYGKINLGLRILGKREDGYHDIETIFHRIRLADRLEFTKAEDVSIECSHPEVPTDARNLCYQAVTRLQEVTGNQSGVRIALQKNIPVGAGLGGGSADAALVLRLLPRLWKRSISEDVCHSIAADLGSDVPFFLGSSSAHGTGRGERLTFHQLALPFTVVVCFPGTIVSTREAYARIHEYKAWKPGMLWNEFGQFLNEGADCGCLGNDFEPLLFGSHPEIRNVKTLMLDQGAQCAFLSGSGSAVYGLFAEPAHAAKAANMLTGRYPLVHVTPSGFVPPPDRLVS